MKRVNIGCGEVFHPDWINLDVAPVSPAVHKLDARKPLPFADATVDAVYHSHVLEHLTAVQGQGFLGECLRVLRPGGVVRVVVPNLEGIARAYIEALENASRGGDPTLYEWCRLELTDQLTRTVSGGEMAPWLLRLTPEQQSIVRQRAGVELTRIIERGGIARRRSISWQYLPKVLTLAHRNLVRCVIGVLGGPAHLRAYNEGMFRQRGEVHRVMYDPHSLGILLREVGFAEARVVGPEESRIFGFADCGLDAVDGEVRKPDSLFMEAIRP